MCVRASSCGQVDHCTGSQALEHRDRQETGQESFLNNALYTDMVGMEKFVRGIASDGLLWGACECVFCVLRSGQLSLPAL